MISKFSDFINEGLIQSLSTDNAFDILKKNLSPDIYILNYGRWCGLKLSVNPKNKKMKKGVLTHLDKIEQILKQIILTKYLMVSSMNLLMRRKA